MPYKLSTQTSVLSAKPAPWRRDFLEPEKKRLSPSQPARSAAVGRDLYVRKALVLQSYAAVMMHVIPELHEPAMMELPCRCMTNWGRCSHYAAQEEGVPGPVVGNQISKHMLVWYADGCFP